MQEERVPMTAVSTKINVLLCKLACPLQGAKRGPSEPCFNNCIFSSNIKRNNASCKENGNLVEA